MSPRLPADRTFDLALIGGGVIGLATARAFLRRNPGARVVVVEKEPELARHQSGRNSGVVHAGLYYPTGSLKALLCRQGRAELLRFAEEHSIPYRVCGKLVVALDEDESARLAELGRRGRDNGLQGLREVDADEIGEIEPHAVGLRALHVPESAVIDFTLVTVALAREVEGCGGRLLLGREVTSLGRSGTRNVVGLDSGERLAAELVISCAGLQSDRVAAMSGLRSLEYRIAPFRGTFYALAPEARELVRGLVYPVPDPTFPFLGVHFTRRIDGEVLAGPNAVPALAREGYGRRDVNLRDARELLAYPGLWRLGRRYYRTGAGELWRDTVKSAAVRNMRRYLPALERRHVAYARCGIRAQVLVRDGTLVDDFLLEREEGIIHVVNAPSPAATASLAIGEWIVSAVEGS